MGILNRKKTWYYFFSVFLLMLKQLFTLSILISLGLFEVQAQMTKGLTGIPDTSFTNYSAFRGTKKKYPFIKMPTTPLSGLAYQADKDIPYLKLAKKSLYLDAFYPKDKTRKPAPAILIIHGGGWRSGDRSQHHLLAEHLAAKGYACFTVQYRLSTEALYPAAVNDLKAAIKWVRSKAKRYNIAPNEVVALGFSAGGELAAFLGVTNNDKQYETYPQNMQVSAAVQAVIDIDGTLSFVHPESGEGDDSKKTSASTFWFGYNKLENLPLLTEGSPLSHVGKNTPPFLFINSSIDRMHAGRDDFQKIMNRYGIYNEVVAFPDSPHAFCLFEPWFEKTVNTIDRFLIKRFSN